MCCHRASGFYRAKTQTRTAGDLPNVTTAAGHPALCHRCPRFALRFGALQSELTVLFSNSVQRMLVKRTAKPAFLFGEEAASSQ